MKKELGETANHRRNGKSDSAFRTISEAAAELGLQQHVLRFWESKFPQIKPLKRAGGRRYYRPEDIEFLQSIRALLHDQGFTIKGVQKLIAQHNGKLPANVSFVPAKTPAGGQGAPTSQGAQAPSGAQDSVADRAAITHVLGELEELQTLLRSALADVKKNP
jgi:DNA-binding transcriptional MerR regulator